MKKVAAALLAAVALAGCNEAEMRQRQQTEDLLNEADRQIGMPSVKNFREKRLTKMLIELRDSEITTYTYLHGMNNELTFLCTSVGYGLPYSTQFTNPQKKQYEVALPQAEPNGLYMPSDAEATWVMCVDQTDKDKAVKPVYVEPRTIVSPFPLQSKESYVK
jgi:hypothetical protein